MTANLTCTKCGVMPKYWHEISFFSTGENEDSLSTRKMKLCSKCINEIWRMVKEFLQDK